MDPSVYSERFYNTAASQAALAFNTFQAFYELRTNHRRSNDQRFGKILERIAESYITVDNYNLLSTRAKDNQSSQELNKFLENWETQWLELKLRISLIKKQPLKKMELLIHHQFSTY